MKIKAELGQPANLVRNRAKILAEFWVRVGNFTIPTLFVQEK